MRYLKALLCLVFIASCLSSLAQKDSIISFNKTLHDFGLIKEVEGNKSFKFTFLNKGKKPILIKNVDASCGCTTGNWTKQPILPGKTGYIDVLFDPSNRPGNFSKILSVYTNLNPSVYQLKIAGNVVPKIRTILDEYPFELSSGIRFKYNQIAFMSVKENSSKRMKLEFLNNSSENISLAFKNLPSYLKILNMSKNISPMQEGFIDFEFSSDKFEDLGFVEKNISFTVNNIKENILISAEICEDFSKLSEFEMSSAPRIGIDDKVYKFINLKKGDYISKSYAITNLGLSKLIIHRIYSKYIMNYELSNYELNPGDSTSLKICLSTSGLVGKQNILVRLISNDPRNHEIKLRFIGEIKD